MSFTPDELKRDLGLSHVEFCEEVPSTQDVARGIVVPPPFLVYARRQSKGRGRLGRGWQSDEGGLYLTLVVNRFAGDWTVPLVSAYILRQGLSTYVDGLILKWPNDVLHQEAKLAGVLVEVWGSRLGIGVGVNVNQTTFDGNLKEHVTSLRLIDGGTHDTEGLLISIVSALMDGVPELRERGFVHFHPRIRKLLQASRQPVRLHHGSDVITGELCDLYPEGDALIETTAGERLRLPAGQLLGGGS